LKEQESQREEEVDLLDLLIILLKRKKLILGITLGAAVLTAIISLLLPPIYRAETKILPPQQGSSGMATQILSQLGGASEFFGAALQMKNPNEMYVEMLKSRTVLDRIIERFHLKKIYRKKYRKDVRKKLLKVLTAFNNKKSGIVSIEVEDKNPQRAAEMANAFVEELKNLTGGLAVTEAAQRRLFFEEQLKDTKTSLVRSEEDIRVFQEKTGALQIDSQTRAVIEGIANLRAQVASREVQLKVLKTYTTAQNPDFQRLEEELRGMKAELAKLGTRREAGPDPLMPTGRMPAVGTEYLRKLRDLKFNETLYALMAKQYEIAKLDEARDAAVIQVIDRAVPPERKAKPRRLLMILLAMVSSFIISLFVAFGAEFLETSSKDPGRDEKFKAIRRYASFRRKER
jgi:uncharacterized protein involved in exopolysaccharide biosynthesis